MKRVALFVGVDEYEDGNIGKLEYAVRDAQMLATVFETQLGFRVRTLTNPDGKKNILAEVRWLTEGLGRGDLFFFFFAGCGFRVKGDLVLASRKDRLEDLAGEHGGLPMGRLKKRMKGAWDRMLAIDAFQNDIRKTRGADEGPGARDLVPIPDDGEDEAGSGDGAQVTVTSCGEGQNPLAVRELGHGLFASALVETVEEHAREGRRLDLAGFRGEMGERMERLAREYRLEGEQKPEFGEAEKCGIVLLEWAVGETKRVKLGGGVVLEMVACPGVGKDFWMGKHAVTQEQWERVMGGNPSHFNGKPRNPVEYVSWNDCQEFVKKLNALSGGRASGLTFRLPMEEEWVTACRAGAPKTARYCKLADGTQITEAILGRVAWHGKGWEKGPTRVGSLEPNAWGLYDMHGNVWEWTSTAHGVYRVICGGCYTLEAKLCAVGSLPWAGCGSASRDLGFRLAASGRATPRQGGMERAKWGESMTEGKRR